MLACGGEPQNVYVGMMCVCVICEARVLTKDQVQSSVGALGLASVVYCVVFEVVQTVRRTTVGGAITQRAACRLATYKF